MHAYTQRTPRVYRTLVYEDVIGSYDPTTSYRGYGFFGSVISVASFTGLNRGGYGLFFGSVVSVAARMTATLEESRCV